MKFITVADTVVRIALISNLKNTLALDQQHNLYILGNMLLKRKLSDYKVKKILKCFSLDLSATQTALILGVNRNTINRYFNLFREAITWASLYEMKQLFGEVGVDESYFGAHRVRGKRGRGAAGKTPVFGLLKRGGRVFVSVVKNCSRDSLMPVIKGVVLERSTIYSNGWKAYDGLILNGYDHYRVFHSKNEFARGKSHVNGIESFWSFAKRRLAKFNGLAAHKFNLHLKECEFRFNYRKQNLFGKMEHVWKSFLTNCQSRANTLYARSLKKTLVSQYRQRGLNKIEISVFSGIEEQENRFAFLVKSARKNKFFHGVIALDAESNWFARSFGKLKRKHKSPVLVLLGEQPFDSVSIPYKIFSKLNPPQVEEGINNGPNLNLIEHCEIANLESRTKFDDLAEKDLDIVAIVKADSSRWTYYCSSSNRSELLECYTRFIKAVASLRDHLGFQMAYKDTPQLRVYGVEITKKNT